MLKHEHYEELCALAAAGQLSESEARELEQHSSNCEECRTALLEFKDLLTELPPLEDTVDLVALRRGEEEGYRNRFLARARPEGRRFSREAEQGNRPSAEPKISALRAFFDLAPQWAAKYAIAAVVAGLLVGGFAYFGDRNAARKTTVLQSSPTLPPFSASSASPKGEALRLTELRGQIRAAKEKITELKAENAALDHRLLAAEKDRDAAETQKGTTDAALAQAKEAKAQLEEQFKQNAVLLADARSELDRLRAEHSVTLASLATERRSADDFARRLQAQSETLDREKELLTAGRDVTDLMGARNLHVVDVYDGDGSGKNRRSFGRIFYTEGKSLIFYAFDLDERKLMNAKYTYKAWGERQATPTSVKELGILYVDDKSQKRWALKVDDPQQLSEIDSVFVTLEPKDGSDTPHGQKLLFAFLGTSSNHP